MKYILASLLLAAPVHAAPVSLAWDANPEPEVTGYRLYMGNYSGNNKAFPFRTYTTVKAPAAVVTVSDAERWYFRVRALAGSSMSDFSNYVLTLPLKVPRLFRK